MQIPEPTILSAIRRAKRELAEAKDIKCVCSGFCIQYEGGCQCERGKKIRKAEAELHNLVKQI